MLDDSQPESPEPSPRVLLVAARAIRVASAAQTEEDLFEGTCALLVESAGYALAWVGIAKHDAQSSVESTASAGGRSYLDAIEVSWADTPLGRGPTGTAIRTGQPVVLNDQAESAAYAPWLESARAHGIEASAAFPITDSGEVVGALNIYSARAGGFDSSECALLGDVADALSLGLTALRQSKIRADSARDLKLAHAQLEAIYQASPDLIFIHGGDGRVLDVNPAAEVFYGMSVEEIRNTDPARLMGDGHTLEEAVFHVQKALENGSEDFAWVGRRGDGTVFPCEVRLRRLPGAGSDPEHPSVLAVSRDLTHLNRLQDEVVQVQRLESLAVLAGGIAHDFNNLLAGILGNIEMASAEPGMSSSALELLDQAESAANRARGLTRQLLAFARGGDGEVAVFDLGELVREVATFVFAGQSVVARLDLPAAPLMVRSDREQLAQVFDNVLRNALEASPRGAAVEVELRLTDSGAAVVIVQDGGSGVDAMDAPRIFEPFYSTKSGGSGLGLSSAFGILRRCGGELALLPSEKGARFRIGIPASLRVEEASESHKPGPPAPGPVRSDRRRALVMDDQADLRRLFTRMLAQRGFTAVPCADGDSALALCREAVAAGSRFSLALLDLTIPGGRGGYEILAELRELDPELCVVAATGYADTDVRTAEFDGLLAKPFGLSVLTEELRRLLLTD